MAVWGGVIVMRRIKGSVADPDPDFLFPDPDHDTDSQFSSLIRIQRFISKNQSIPANSLAK
jgi:hypothetical protein